MHKDSIEWTSFSCPLGYFEWLVMTFGLRNAPQIFQRMMDDIFKECYNFTCVYIDDVLVFSKSEKEHLEHLYIIFSLFKKQVFKY